MFSSLSLNNLDNLQVKQLQSILKEGGFTSSFERKELYINKIKKLIRLAQEDDCNYEDDNTIDTKSITDVVGVLIVGSVRGAWTFSDVTVFKSDDDIESEFKNELRNRGVLTSIIDMLTFDDVLEKLSEGIFSSKILVIDRDCVNYKRTIKTVKKYTKCRFITFQSEDNKIKDECYERTNDEMSTTTLINIDNYTRRFDEYPSDLIIFAKENKLTLIPLTSMRGQALALLSQPDVRGQKHLGRDEAVKFFKNIGMETTDAIQQFNKATGLKRMKMRGYYCLQYPFECDTTDIDKRKGVCISGDKNSYINIVKDWWKKNLVDVPNEEWQIGHLDPTINDSSEKNLAYQPPIQGKYRDRFKFDAFFLKMWPTASELVPKMDKFYTNEEQHIIYEALNQKFQKK